MKSLAVSWHHEPVTVVGISQKNYESETAFQIYCSTWLRKQAALNPNNPSFDFWHHSANERFGARAGLVAKLMGQSKGFPDFVHLRSMTALELKLPAYKKRPAGELRPEQEKWANYLQTIGWNFQVIRNVSEFQCAVLSLSVR